MTDLDHKMVEMAIREEGKAEGKAEGRTEEKIEIALNLIKIGVAFESISVAVGLSVEELQEMKESLEG